MAQGVAFAPTEDQRRTVKAMAGFGVPQEDIAKHLEIDAKTLRLHFRRDLDNGTLEANAKVARSLFNMATQGKNVAGGYFLAEGPRGLAREARARAIDDRRPPAWRSDLPSGQRQAAQNSSGERCASSHTTAQCAEGTFRRLTSTDAQRLAHRICSTPTNDR